MPPTKTAPAAPPAAPAPAIDRAELLRQRSAVAWRPNPGDMIDGTIVRILKRETNPEFGAYPLVLLDTGDPLYTAVHAFHSLLRDQLAEIKAKPGDEISIVYQGKLESKNDAPERDDEGKPRKRKYHAYILVSNGVDASTDFTWDDEKPSQRGSGDEPDVPGF